VSERPWLIVTGDFTPTGGMDRANHALASYLLREGREVHLVAHRVADDLRELGAEVHEVPKPLGSYFLAEPLLDRAGRRWAKRLAARGPRVVVNGGNCGAEGTCWVHYVHAAWEAPRVGSPARRLKAAGHRRRALEQERRALERARLVISNSERTTRDLVGRLGVSEGRIERVYLGVERERFVAASSQERVAARARLGWERPVALFVGGLGDRRKGFDRALAAWSQRAETWDLDLVHVGGGPGLADWQGRVADRGLSGRVHFLGFREDVPQLLQAADLLVSPTRYEPYGLGVHEALCCGLPAVVSRGAGVAERYSPELRELLLDDPEDTAELVRRIEAWQREPQAWAERALRLGDSLRERGWDEVAADLCLRIEARA
jgi:glycosyltransferase involved in cell wall biosynthesis